MTRVEKIVMAVLILAIIGTVIFWKDVSSVFSNNKENVVENERKKGRKDKKDSGDDGEKKKKDKDEDSESFLNYPSSNSLFHLS